MYYAVEPGHSALSRLIEISESIADDRRPMSCHSAGDVAEFLLRPVAGAPDASLFDVVALEAEDNDIHVLLHRKADGMLARASYIEGDDIGDDVNVFEFVTEENLERVVARFDRWCQFNLEDEDEQAYRALVSDMVRIEEKEEDRLTADILAIAPTMSQLEALTGQVRTESLRSAISDALASIKAACRPA